MSCRSCMSHVIIYLYWVLYVSILDLMLNFRLNSLTILEQGLTNGRQIICFKVVPTITFVNVYACASSCFLRSSQSPSSLKLKVTSLS